MGSGCGKASVTPGVARGKDASGEHSRANTLINGTPLVVFAEFSAEQAGPCRMIRTILQNLGVRQDDLAIYDLDGMRDGAALESEVTTLCGLAEPPMVSFVQ